MTDAAQSARTKSGKAFEKYVFGLIPVEALNKSGKTAYLGSALKKERPLIATQLTINPTYCGGFLGDVDIVVYDEIAHTPVLIISTKTSIRERTYQVMCTKSMYQRIFPNISVWFVTKNSGEELGKWKDEFGSQQHPLQSRKLVTTYNIPCYVEDQRTIEGGMIKHLSHLNDDIKRIYCG